MLVSRKQWICNPGLWSTRHFFNLQSGVIAYTNNYGRNGHILQYKMFGKYCHWTFCTFKDKLIYVWYIKQSLTLVFGTVFIGWNQLQIFDNDNFSIIPKSIFSDNNNLPISSKNAEISAVDNVFDNIAHPYGLAAKLCWLVFPFWICQKDPVLWKLSVVVIFQIVNFHFKLQNYIIVQIDLEIEIYELSL